MLNYKNDFRSYQVRRPTQNVTPLPAGPELLVRYLEHLSKINTSATVLGKVDSLHSLIGLKWDTSKAPTAVVALKRANRTLGRAQQQATPLTRERLEMLKAVRNQSTRGTRNRILQQLGVGTFTAAK